MRDALIEQIIDGTLGLDELLVDHFLRDLHGRLYGDIWTWVGRFRTRELNLGVAPEQIAVELRSSLDTIRWRWEHTSDWTAALIDGTITQTRELGVRRKNAPKRTRQGRRIALPSMAAAASVTRRLALADRGAEALLSPTATGSPMSVSNYERLLRPFVDDNRDTLTAIGVDPDRYSTHIYRRIVATLVEQAAGITLASRLLGHANEQITRASYVVSAEQVDPITVDILDAVLGS